MKEPTSALEEVTDDFKTEAVGGFSCPSGATDFNTPKTLDSFDLVSLEDVASLLRIAVEENDPDILEGIRQTDIPPEVLAAASKL